MATNMRNLIEYNGIGNCNIENVDYFKQNNIDFTFSLPSQKPSIEQILKVWVKPSILQQKIVRTPKGESLEGQKVTGYKCMVSGEIAYKVEYIGLEPTQTLHTAHTMIPFCGYIVLPENFNMNAVLIINAQVEDIYSETLDMRSIYNNITMLLIADIC